MPRFSIITPVYRPERRSLQAMLDSVNRQTYGDWEHCLVDDRSDDPATRDLLEQAAGDRRVRVSYRDRNGGIVAASNDALSMARGEFVAFLDHDDELAPQALETVAAALAVHPDAEYLYSDEDKVDVRGRHFEPFLKPAWSPDRLRAQMYTGHLCVVRRSLVDELGGLRSGLDGAQDWDLALRVAERSERIVNVPGILYHWHAVAGSEAQATEAKPWAHDASRRALAEAIERHGVQASVETIPGYPGLYWLRPALVDSPLVSIVIVSEADAGEAAGGVSLSERARRITERSTYENHELIEAQAGSGFSAKVNLAVERCEGEQILLLRAGLEVPPPGWRPHPADPEGIPDWGAADAAGRRDWIESLLVYAMQPGMGAAGSKVYLPDGRLSHASVVLRDGEPICPYQGMPGSITGYGANLLVAANFIAVPAAGMITSREAFETVGGFDEGLPRPYADVDYCLRLRERGLRSVSVPQVELIDFGNEVADPWGRPQQVAHELFRRRWAAVFEDDPFYRSTFIDGDFTLPTQARDGDFRPRSGLGHYIDRLRHAYGRSPLRDLVERVRR